MSLVGGGIKSMYIARVVIDEWAGNDSRESVINRPTTNDVEHAIKQLDAKHHTMVVLEADDGKHMQIGGGCGRFIVCASIDAETHLQLRSVGSGDEVVLLNVGGQEGDYPSSMVVDQSVATQAALVFATSGQLSKDMTWDA